MKFRIIRNHDAWMYFSWEIHGCIFHCTHCTLRYWNLYTIPHGSCSSRFKFIITFFETYVFRKHVFPSTLFISFELIFTFEMNCMFSRLDKQNNKHFDSIRKCLFLKTNQEPWNFNEFEMNIIILSIETR